MDISDTLAPNSDQLDAVDLRGNPPRIFTVTKVDVKTNADQPVSVHLAEFDRVWRPGKSMRRVLAYCWGKDSAGWTGHQVELYCDDRVMFGGEAIGGTRISRLSHIDGPQTVPLITGRGKSGVWKVQPLPSAPAAPEPLTADQITAATDVKILGQWWKQHPDQRTAIEERVAELKAATEPETDEIAGGDTDA